MKRMTIFILAMFSIFQIYGQVGINTNNPHASAALDVTSNSQGILIPRLTTAEKTTIASPAEGLLVYDTNLKCIAQNAGTTASPAWVCLSDKDAQNSFFYMPAIAIDASAVVAGQSIDLYDEYKKQFTAPSKGSVGAPTSIPYFSNPKSLYYYITDYDDTTIQINSLSDEGVLNYDVLKEADFNQFMNIVFVVK